MFRVPTFDAKVQNLQQVDAIKFGIVPPSFLLRERARHVIEHVMPRFTHIRPDYCHSGEAEIFILEPLYALSLSILERTAYERGIVLKTFLDFAQRFGVAAEVMNMTGSKPIADALGDLMMDKLPMISTFAPREKPATVKGKDEVIKVQSKDRAYAYLNSALSMSDSHLNEWPTKLPGRNVKIDATKSTEIVARITEYGGIGRGAYLPTENYIIQIRKMVTIERAINALYNPSLLPFKEDAKEVAPMYEDAYCLAIAYIGYLHHTKTNESYDALFSPMPTAAQAATRTAKQQISARRLATLYAGFASAAKMADVKIVSDLLDNTLEFFKPLLIVQNHVMSDINAEMARVKESLAKFIFAPILAHSEYITKAVADLASLDRLLPAFVQHYFSLPEVTLPSEVEAPRGELEFTTSSFSRAWIDPNIVDDFLSITYTIVQDARRTVDDMANQMMYYYGMSTDFNPNELQLPADMLSATPIVVKAEDIAYYSLFSAEFAPLGVPRYIYDAKSPESRKGLPAIKSYLNTAIFVSAFREKLRTEKGRYIFNATRPIPAASGLGYRFATIPLPFPYARGAVYPSVPNIAEDIENIMKIAVTQGAPTSQYFHDAALLLAFNSFQRQSVLNALAGLCQVYDVAKEEYLLPSIPAIYGIPTLAFLQKNRGKSAPKLEVQVKNASSKDVKTIRFVFHQFVPKPAPTMDVPFLLNSGNVSSVPVQVKAYFAAFDYRSSGEDNDAPEESPKDNYRFDAFAKDVAEVLAMTPSEALNKSGVAWLPVSAWSPTFVAYPHLFCNYVPSFTEWAEPAGVSLFLFRKIQRVFQTGGPNLMAQSSVDATIVMPTVEDLQAIIDDAPPSIDPEKDPVMNHQAEKPNTTSGPKPNNPVAPLTTPTHASPTDDDAADSIRRITTDGIITEQAEAGKVKATTVSGKPIKDPKSNKDVDPKKFKPSATFWGDIESTVDADTLEDGSLDEASSLTPEDTETEEDFRARVLAFLKSKEKKSDQAPANE